MVIVSQKLPVYFYKVFSSFESGSRTNNLSESSREVSPKLPDHKVPDKIICSKALKIKEELILILTNGCKLNS